MPYARICFVTLPTGWDRETVCQYAEHRVRRGGAVPAGSRVALRLGEFAEQANQATSCRVTYVVHQQ